MKQSNFLALCTTLAALLMHAGAASAHANKDQSTKPAAVKKEQKDWGIAGDAKTVKRTVKFTMSDAMRFAPNVLQVKQGETLRLVIKNEGKLFHEFVLGTQNELEDHAALMIKFCSTSRSTVPPERGP